MIVRPKFTSELLKTYLPLLRQLLIPSGDMRKNDVGIARLKIARLRLVLKEDRVNLSFQSLENFASSLASAAEVNDVDSD